MPDVDYAALADEIMIQGWHFTAQPGILRDGSPFALSETIRVEGEIVPCKRGLHASPTVLDASRYAPGLHLYRVELRGTIIPHGDPVDKHAASERVALAYVDATPLLRLFARQCALDVLHLWDAPPVVCGYLLTAAAWAAWDVTRAKQSERLDAWALAYMESGTLPEVALPTESEVRE